MNITKMSFFTSKIKHLANITLPGYTGVHSGSRVIIGDLDSLPSSVKHYGPTLKQMFDLCDTKMQGHRGYLLVDEARKSFSYKPNLHVDHILFDYSSGQSFKNM